MKAAKDHRLGNFLKDRRARLDPVAFGFSQARRRTPGLRREEVAQRASVSTTWYTWLEQGRGGAPSAGALARIADALMLTDMEREHLFLLALGRPPEAHFRAPEGVSPRLQRVLDALALSPAVVKTATWDVVAWNRAAAMVLTDYAAIAPEQRNVLRMIFLRRRAGSVPFEWESVARSMVRSFRADVMRAGAAQEVEGLVRELSLHSPTFKAMWHDSGAPAQRECTKQVRHPRAGVLALEYSAFAVDGRHDLNMVVFNPATPKDAERIKTLIESSDQRDLISRRHTTRSAVTPHTPRSRPRAKNADRD